MSHPSSFQTDKKRLYEISVIRLIVILSLVVNHSFVKIANGGLRSNEYRLPDFYRWLNYYNFEMTLELFVLISGFLFAFQTITLQRNYSLKLYIQKKAHRLLLPMIVYGIVYYFCFYFNPESFTFTGFILELLGGCGHLWFLPMLFWCLILIWFLVRFHVNEKIILACLAIISVIKYLPLPLGFARVSHYLFYAYFGFYLYKQKGWVIDCFTKNKWLIPCLWVSYVIFVWLGHSSGVTSTTADSLLFKGLVIAREGTLELLACISGILALFGTIYHFTQSRSFRPSPWIQKADKMSFGMYIYHQFILVALYHYTHVVEYINAWLLPWIGFIIAIAFSVLLTSLTLRTKWGRFLIG